MSAAQLNFEKLDVWRKSIDLAQTIYAATSHFPVDERFGLTNQMRRAAVSISSNIAEGCSRRTKQDFTRYIEIATGSAFEVSSQSEIALGQGWITPDAHQSLRLSVIEIVRMLSGLRDSLKD